jgi:hypothetical protein
MDAPSLLRVENQMTEFMANHYISARTPARVLFPAGKVEPLDGPAPAEVIDDLRWRLCSQNCSASRSNEKIIKMIGKLPYQNHALPIAISKVLAPKLKPDSGHHSPGTVLLPFADRSTCGQAQSPLTMPEFVILE